MNASPLLSCNGGDGSGACFDEERWAYIASQVGAQQHLHAQGSLQVVSGGQSLLARASELRASRGSRFIPWRPDSALTPA